MKNLLMHDMKQTIRFFFMLMALMMGATVDVWAVDKKTENGYTVIVNKEPNVDAGTVTVSSISTEGLVTMTVTPASSYYTKKSLITATKMINADAAPRRGSVLAGDIDISGSDEEISSETTFSFTIPSGYKGANVIVQFYQKSEGYTQIYSLSEIVDFSASARYEIVCDVDGSTLGSSIATFAGTLDGGLHTITGLSVPLFSTLSGATIKNVILDKVGISSGDSNGHAGAIACVANGASRIYNCGILSGSVGGGSNGDVGGLVGTLNNTSRVINCFSYANITAGKNKAGIVGNNTGTSKQTSITTMVMNCMFYGDIADGNAIAPIYGGTEIANAAGGLPNYNFYRYNSRYSIKKKISKYNCALAMEEKFINRFERYRLLLNSNKKLAAWYVTGNVDDAAMIAKWVLETADRTIRQPMPYPILKKQGKYPSIINIDADHAEQLTLIDGNPSEQDRNKGGKIGFLSVTISGVGDNAASGAKLLDINGNETNESRTININRTDKDFGRYNYNYDKIQLPYYNDYGTKNYTDNKVVTGWEITEITNGTTGKFEAKDGWGGYNFANRNCTNKDKYNKDSSGDNLTGNRVFSQGAYYDVPYGVTGITIKPHWATAAYVSDERFDVAYKKDYGTDAVEDMGKQKTKITINDDEQDVFTTIEAARASMAGSDGQFASGATVYDYAVVLVGNVHQAGDPTTANTPYTIMSIDQNHDNEPDYSFIFGHDNRKPISPIRYDFLNLMGIAEAQMPKGASLFRNVSIFKPMGWFEITNTCVVTFSQFEYDNGSKSLAPLILLGGVFNQFVSTVSSNPDHNTSYIHVGGNAWFAKFGNGTHSDGNFFTPHIPISVTGGDYAEFYLSGTYQPAISNMKSDDAECYVSGGRFGEMAGASLEKIQGNVQWDIDRADITNFYGGGVNANNPITGNIKVDINNSYVNRYCGGPKFGDMTGVNTESENDDKNVITSAEGCTFETFFGAGYGGNSYNRVKYFDAAGLNPADKQDSYETDRGNYFDGTTTYANATDNNTKKYGKKGKGVATDFDYEFFVWSSGKTGGRFYVKFASFSLAKCNNVESKLKKCTITKDFYGGGSLGKVNGTATSVLDDCTVRGNVFGGGYSASIPTIPVRNTPAFVSRPSVNTNIGMFEMAEIADSVEYEWKHVDQFPNNNQKGIESGDDGNFVYTDQNLETLGQVRNSNIIIKGSTTILGSVYGGGALASMDTDGETKVNLIGGTIYGDVYGGGQGRLAGTQDDKGKLLPEVSALVGNANVNLNGIDATDYKSEYTTLEQNGDAGSYVVKDSEKGCIVKGSIFGCNNLNGTPKGDVMVHIYKTQNAAASRITNPAEGAQNAKVKGRYDVKAAYGGGNLAPYEPNATVTTGTDEVKEASKPAATVIIDGCDRSSIGQVYGGGNAASTPATSVTVNGTYEIGELFGGGNGKDDISKDGGVTWIKNPGANVGFKDYSEHEKEEGFRTKEERQDANNTAFKPYIYGSGKASVNIKGGTIHQVFGGSNTKGNVRITAVTMLEEVKNDSNEPICPFHVDEAYGGGKSAPMDAEARLLMACIPGLEAAYGGAEAADIHGNVELNITNGNFDRVFGGNNKSGTINGSITVNIEETGCKPIIIGELYGGGNLAGYSKYGYKLDEEGETMIPIEDPNDPEALKDDDIYGDPEVNVKSFTSIGDIYGGGYGETAVMVGNPTVNINVGMGDKTNYTDESTYKVGETDVPYYDVNGFKELTKTIDGHTVIIPQHKKGMIGAVNNVFGGGNAAKVIGNTNVNIGTLAEVYLVKEVTTGSSVAGLYIRNNNGSYSDATGTAVDGTTYYEKKDVEGVDIRGNVYGGGNNAEVTGNTNVTIGKQAD